MNELVISLQNAEQVPSLPVADLNRAAEFARAEKASSTRKAYGSDFSIFRDWCFGRGVNALPASPETVAAFLGCEAESGLRPSTITRRCASIRYAHKLACLDSPTDSEVVKATFAESIARWVPHLPARHPYSPRQPAPWHSWLRNA